MYLVYVLFLFCFCFGTGPGQNGLVQKSYNLFVPPNNPPNSITSSSFPSEIRNLAIRSSITVTSKQPTEH
ncbi:hypothetical protein E1A91_A12G158400v1 [Gossypium mustelinum]|uniref:Secreted protein n=1 Tax=Gossypium mustelinum TaxID=34275 RepID=A0A5D2WUM1_GOSMU|nr:hypothetical protein E1A91_A12G158400v1 [Gossypium mustelinum]